MQQQIGFVIASPRSALLEIYFFLQCDQIGILLRDLSKSFYLQK